MAYANLSTTASLHIKYINQRSRFNQSHQSEPFHFNDEDRIATKDLLQSIAGLLTTLSARKERMSVLENHIFIDHAYRADASTTDQDQS